MSTASAPTVDARVYDPENGADEHGRHWRIGILCDAFHDIIVGQEAAALLADPDALPEYGALFAAPSYVFGYASIAMGRKEYAKSGQRLMMPGRLTWTTGTLTVLADGETLDAGWSFAGLGRSGMGTTTVTTSHVADEHTDPSTVPATQRVEVLPRHLLVSRLEALVMAGKTARWSCIAYLEQHVVTAVQRAHHSVVQELETLVPVTAVLDPTKLETVADHMLLGDDDHPGKVSQLIDRMTGEPRVFRNVEPLKYIKEALRRDANAEVRKAIGDPHIGPKVRKVARELGTRDVATVVAAYRKQYPNDKLSETRAQQALTVGADAMASWLDYAEVVA